MTFDHSIHVYVKIWNCRRVCFRFYIIVFQRWSFRSILRLRIRSHRLFPRLTVFFWASIVIRFSWSSLFPVFIRITRSSLLFIYNWLSRGSLLSIWIWLSVFTWRVVFSYRSCILLLFAMDREVFFMRRAGRFMFYRFNYWLDWLRLTMRFWVDFYRFSIFLNGFAHTRFGQGLVSMMAI